MLWPGQGTGPFNPTWTPPSCPSFLSPSSSLKLKPRMRGGCGAGGKGWSEADRAQLSSGQGYMWSLANPVSHILHPGWSSPIKATPHWIRARMRSHWLPWTQTGMYEDLGIAMWAPRNPHNNTTQHKWTEQTSLARLSELRYSSDNQQQLTKGKSPKTVLPGYGGRGGGEKGQGSKYHLLLSCCN